MENNIIKKLKRDLPYDLEIPLLGIYPGKNKNSNLKRYMNFNVHCSTIYNSKTWKQHKGPSTDDWLKTHTQWHTAITKSVILSHTHTHTHNGTQP